MSTTTERICCECEKAIIGTAFHMGGCNYCEPCYRKVYIGGADWEPYTPKTETRRRIRYEFDEDAPVEGWFEQWSPRGGRRWPVAIVELDDGKVDMWDAEWCRFIDREKHVVLPILECEDKDDDSDPMF